MIIKAGIFRILGLDKVDYISDCYGFGKPDRLFTAFRERKTKS